MAILNSPKENSSVQRQAYAQLLELPQKQRIEGLQHVVDADLPLYSPEALSALYTSNAHPRVKPGKFLKWDSDSQTRVLNNLLYLCTIEPRKEFYVLPAALLKSEAKIPQMPTDTATLILCHDKKYKPLLEELVRKYPSVPRLWLALSRSGLLSDDVKALGLKSFLDPHTEPYLKLRIAIAISPDNKEAQAHVEQRISKALLDYGGLTPEAATALGLYLLQEESAAKDEEKYEAASSYLMGMPLAFLEIAPLRFYKGPKAHELLLSAARGGNAYIAQFAALVLAENSPMDFFDTIDKQKLGASQYLPLVKLMLKWHPKMKEQISARLTGEERTLVLSRLEMKDVMALTPGFGVFVRS